MATDRSVNVQLSTDEGKRLELQERG